MSQDFFRQVVVTTFTSVICPRCTEKANYFDSAHDNGVDSIGSIHDEMKAARLLFLKGLANLCCQRRLFLLDPTTTFSKNFNFEQPLLVIRVSVERCTVQEKWCYASRVYDIEIKSFAENDRRRPTRSQTNVPSLSALRVYSLWANECERRAETREHIAACLLVERHLISSSRSPEMFMDVCDEKPMVLSRSMMTKSKELPLECVWFIMWPA